MSEGHNNNNKGEDLRRVDDDSNEEKIVEDILTSQPPPKSNIGSSIYELSAELLRGGINKYLGLGFSGNTSESQEKTVEEGEIVVDPSENVQGIQSQTETGDGNVEDSAQFSEESEIESDEEDVGRKMVVNPVAVNVLSNESEMKAADLARRAQIETWKAEVKARCVKTQCIQSSVMKDWIEKEAKRVLQMMKNAELRDLNIQNRMDRLEAGFTAAERDEAGEFLTKYEVLVRETENERVLTEAYTTQQRLVTEIHRIEMIRLQECVKARIDELLKMEGGEIQLEDKVDHALSLHQRTMSHKVAEKEEQLRNLKRKQKKAEHDMKMKKDEADLAEIRRSAEMTKLNKLIAECNRVKLEEENSRTRWMDMEEQLNTQESLRLRFNHEANLARINKENWEREADSFRRQKNALFGDVKVLRQQRDTLNKDVKSQQTEHNKNCVGVQCKNLQCSCRSNVNSLEALMRKTLRATERTSDVAKGVQKKQDTLSKNIKKMMSGGFRSTLDKDMSGSFINNDTMEWESDESLSSINGRSDSFDSLGGIDLEDSSIDQDKRDAEKSSDSNNSNSPKSPKKVPKGKGRMKKLKKGVPGSLSEDDSLLSTDDSILGGMQRQKKAAAQALLDKSKEDAENDKLVNENTRRNSGGSTSSGATRSEVEAERKKRAKKMEQLAQKKKNKKHKKVYNISLEASEPDTSGSVDPADSSVSEDSQNNSNNSSVAEEATDSFLRPTIDLTQEDDEEEEDVIIHKSKGQTKGSRVVQDDSMDTSTGATGGESRKKSSNKKDSAEGKEKEAEKTADENTTGGRKVLETTSDNNNKKTESQEGTRGVETNQQDTDEDSSSDELGGSDAAQKELEKIFETSSEDDKVIASPAVVDPEAEKRRANIQKYKKLIKISRANLKAAADELEEYKSGFNDPDTFEVCDRQEGDMEIMVRRFMKEAKEKEKKLNKAVKGQEEVVTTAANVTVPLVLTNRVPDAIANSTALVNRRMFLNAMAAYYYVNNGDKHVKCPFNCGDKQFTTGKALRKHTVKTAENDLCGCVKEREKTELFRKRTSHLVRYRDLKNKWKEAKEALECCEEQVAEYKKLTEPKSNESSPTSDKKKKKKKKAKKSKKRKRSESAEDEKQQKKSKLAVKTTVVTAEESEKMDVDEGSTEPVKSVEDTQPKGVNEAVKPKATIDGVPEPIEKKNAEEKGSETPVKSVATVAPEKVVVPTKQVAVVEPSKNKDPVKSVVTGVKKTVVPEKPVKAVEPNKNEDSVKSVVADVKKVVVPVKQVATVEPSKSKDPVKLVVTGEKNVVVSEKQVETVESSKDKDSATNGEAEVVEELKEIVDSWVDLVVLGEEETKTSEETTVDTGVVEEEEDEEDLQPSTCMGGRR